MISLKNFKSDRYSDIGIKKLIWVKNGSNWKITKESWKPQSNTKTKQEELATISNNLSDESTTKEIAPKNLDRWVHAWENQDIELYLSFYSKEFVATNGRYSDWRVDRIAALKGHSNISIQLENIKIFSSKDTAEIDFIQNFKSDRYSDIGTKKLILVKNGSDWKITKETWKPQ